jgi:streptogrisin B
MPVSRVLRRLATSAVLTIALTGAAVVAAAPAHAATNPPIGSVVCHVGPTTGTRCGVVTAVNATINYPGGTISGVFLYNACSAPRDGGAPIFRQSTGLQVGTVLGSVGQCRTAGLPLP